MSFRHLLYVGDFEVDGSDQPWLRMTRTPDDPIYRPVVRHPLDSRIVEKLATRDDAAVGIEGFPPGWSISAEAGYLACDRYALGVDEIDFLRRLVEEAGCRLFERGFEVSADDLSPRGCSDPRALVEDDTLTVGPPMPANGTMPEFKP